MTKIENRVNNENSFINDTSFKRMLDLEFDNKLALDENKNYKKFLEYMEKNYENQFQS